MAAAAVVLLQTRLVALSGGGDAEAFEQLVEPLLGRLALLVRLRGRDVLGPDVGVEDVVQAALLRAWQLLPSFEYRGPEALFGWLAALAGGVLADRARYVVRKGRGGVRSLDEGLGRAPPDTSTSITKVVARREQVERVVRAIEALEPAQRVVLERHLLDGVSLGQLAAELGVTKNAVWERLQRGLRLVRAAAGQA